MSGLRKQGRRLDAPLVEMNLAALPRDIPLIVNAELAVHAKTHRSIFKDQASKSADDLKNDELASYKRLEMEGGAWLRVHVTRLLHDEYPNLVTGPIDSIRNVFLSNITLAHIARFYHMTDDVIMDRLDKDTDLHLSRAVLANSFEAYVGALHRDVDLRDSVATRELAFNDIVKWIRSIYTPLVFPQFHTYALHANDIAISNEHRALVPDSYPSKRPDHTVKGKKRKFLEDETVEQGYFRVYAYQKVD